MEGEEESQEVGGKAGLSTRPDNGDPQETAEEDFPRCRTGVLALENTHIHTHMHYFIPSPSLPALIPHKQGHPHPHGTTVSPQQRKKKPRSINALNQ